jgi:hypothetical protein
MIELAELDYDDTVWSLEQVLPFKEHAGETVRDVIINDVDYITWCIENMDSFILDNGAYALYERFLEHP